MIFLCFQSSFNRPDFKRMDEGGKVGTVIVKHLQTGMLMEIIFPQYDVRFIAVNDGMSRASRVSDLSSSKNCFNFYARDTSRKIRAVQKAKGERGERVGTTVPYGYMKNPDNPKQFIRNPETAPIVKRIFEMHGSGIGIVKICDGLPAKKAVCQVYTPLKQQANKPYHWAQTTVRKMLLKQKYVSDTVNFKTLKNDSENILIFKPLNLCKSILAPR